ncbi:hypothetical protein AURDEDRAFT_125912 [Auricularia subglabra TFB-10046 SS5]|nr:hypothetical protein AURDEDRAFT_125912 [Auricularia subglabra TFB-10046 SS5]
MSEFIASSRIPIPRGFASLQSTGAIMAALGWDARVYGSVQSLVRRSAVEYLDKGRALFQQHPSAVRQICQIICDHFPDLPLYEKDWHVKAILRRYLRNAARRTKRARQASQTLPSPSSVSAECALSMLTNSPSPPAAASTNPSSPPPASTDTSSPQPASTGENQHGDSIPASRPCSPEYESASPPPSAFRVTDLLPVDKDSLYPQGNAVYRAMVRGRALWLHTDTSCLLNYVSRRTALTSNARLTPSADAPVFVEDTPCFTKVYITVTLDRVVEDIAAYVLPEMPYDAQLILGVRWLRDHNGCHDWDNVKRQVLEHFGVTSEQRPPDAPPVMLLRDVFDVLCMLLGSHLCEDQLRLPASSVVGVFESSSVLPSEIDYCIQRAGRLPSGNVATDRHELQRPTIALRNGARTASGALSALSSVCDVMFSPARLLVAPGAGWAAARRDPGFSRLGDLMDASSSRAHNCMLKDQSGWNIEPRAFALRTDCLPAGTDEARAQRQDFGRHLHEILPVKPAKSGLYKRVARGQGQGQEAYQAAVNSLYEGIRGAFGDGDGRRRGMLQRACLIRQFGSFVGTQITVALHITCRVYVVALESSVLIRRIRRRYRSDNNRDKDVITCLIAPAILVGLPYSFPVLTHLQSVDSELYQDPDESEGVVIRQEGTWSRRMFGLHILDLASSQGDATAISTIQHAFPLVTLGDAYLWLAYMKDVRARNDVFDALIMDTFRDTSWCALLKYGGEEATLAFPDLVRVLPMAARFNRAVACDNTAQEQNVTGNVYDNDMSGQPRRDTGEPSDEITQSDRLSEPKQPNRSFHAGEGASTDANGSPHHSGGHGQSTPSPVKRDEGESSSFQNVLRVSLEPPILLLLID